MFVKVRAEEVLIGSVLGAGLGLAVSSPLTAGMPSLIPTLANGAWPALQASVALALAGAGAAAGAWLAGHQERDTHYRGAQYFSGYREAAKRLQAIEAQQFSAAQKGGQVHGITVGGVELARSTEGGHVYVVGLPGAGKTVLLNSVIGQVRARGERILVHDPKGDFVERYYDPQHVVLLGPWDSRAAIWDAASDIDSPALADEFGVATCGGGESAGQNRFFHDAAGLLLAGLIRSHQIDGKSCTWSDLSTALSAPPFELIRAAAKGNAQIKSVMPSAFTGGEMTQGERAVLSVLGTSTAWLANYAALDRQDPDRPRFSLRKWLTREAHADTQIVILNVNSLYQRAGEAIFGSMLSAIAGVVSSPVLPEVSADAGGGTFLILDEFPQLGNVALEKVQQIAEVGRSRGVREVLALQDETQLIAKATRDKAEPMLAVQSVRIYMHSSDKTAEAVSKRIGQREVLRIDTTAQDGAVAGKTKRAETQTVIQPSDLLGLRVRKQKEPLGVELIMHINDTLGRLVQPFPERSTQKQPRFVVSETWRRGALPDAAALVQTTDAQEQTQTQGPARAGEEPTAGGAGDDRPDIF